LIPLVELLRPAWQLEAMGSDLERALLDQAQQANRVEVRRWTELVAELGSPKFPVRAAAQRELQRAGQSALPFLQGLDRGQLDAEQLARVRELVDQLSVEYEDSAQRLAIGLANDPAAWLALLSRPDAAKRTVAAGQLQKVTEGPLEFDPNGDESARATQVERLKSRLTPMRVLPATAAEEADAEGDDPDKANSVPPPGGER
jgi:hypothetical protein